MSDQNWEPPVHQQESQHDEASVEAVDSDAPDAADGARAGHTQGALPLNVRTGDADVDAAVARLGVLDGMPIEDHAEVFTEVHRALQDALVDLDRN